ncbi:toll/interleukin-1 receptor domain-containing protein, partial [bacterium]|nr:toll/interleukin-1 receptor domain-containing protein [bacterium]
MSYNYRKEFIIEYKYRAFISYSHRDDLVENGNWGEWVHKSIENYSVPGSLIIDEVKRGRELPHKIFPVFRDRNELPTANDLQEQIELALTQSEYLIIICSPNSAKSFYVNSEILYFKRLGREHKILPIIIAGEPNAGSKKWITEEECFPQSLKFSIGNDGEL